MLHVKTSNESPSKKNEFLFLPRRNGIILIYNAFRDIIVTPITYGPSFGLAVILIFTCELIQIFGRRTNKQNTDAETIHLIKSSFIKWHLVRMVFWMATIISVCYLMVQHCNTRQIDSDFGKNTHFKLGINFVSIFFTWLPAFSVHLANS